MTGLGFVILFGLNFVFFPCEGQISLPPGGDTFVVLPGEDVEILWDISDIEIPKLSIRKWGFIPTNELLARIIDDEAVDVRDSSLKSGVTIQKPSTLILKNVNAKYNGTYDFIVEVGRDNYVSYVHVFVAVKPNVTVSCSSPVIVNEGDDFTCVCRGEGGNPPADVTWYKDGVKIGETGKDEQTLTLRNVAKTASGTYKCLAQSHTLKDEKSIVIIVHFKPSKPVITFTPEKAVLGGSVTVRCESDGLPTPSFNITHNGTEVSTNKEHTISPVKWSDAGTYECFVNNTLGNGSHSKDLIVQEQGPTTTTSPESTKVESMVEESSGLSGGAIAGIVIGVLALIVIVVVVVYCFFCKSGEKDGYRGNANVIPGGKGESHYELDENERGGRGENTYDTANTSRSDNGASGSKSKPADTLPAVYSTVDRDNREGKPLYATLDTAALRSNGSKKQDEDRPEPTQYASIDHGRVAEVPKADLV